MNVTLVYVTVKKEHIDDFIKATQANHLGSIQEPGNRRFDVIQSDEDPCKFVLIEAFKSPEDAADHKKTAHYLAWRDQVAEWMAEPRKGVSFNGLFVS